ncbi:MAG: ATP-binding protein [Micromonosporaceae bacterium]
MARPPVGLTGRLFAAQAVAVLTGAITHGLVAAAVGPAIFYRHLRQISGQVDAETGHHVEEAYASASRVSFSVALLAALVAALAVSAYLARRVARPVGQLAAAAADVAEGRYTTLVEAPGLGAECDLVASSFNAMAARLADVEENRRRMLADLGHEMRTPVATIEAYLEAAEDGVAVDGEDILSVLRTQTARLRRLADDIAAVSRTKVHYLDLHLVRTAPADLVRVATAAARPRYATQGVVLHERVAADVPDIDADPERIGQVLGNLLDNALRHTPRGGRVSVALHPDPAGVRITVSDTGEGIAAEHLPHVFERFYRGDSTRDRRPGGSGIGLSIVRMLVDEHGGRVTAESGGPGSGATFTLILPAVQTLVTVGDPPSGR